MAKKEITVDLPKEEKGPGRNKEQEVQQKLLLYQLLQNQLEELKKQGQVIQAKYTEIEATRMALDDLEKIKKEREILIPLGSGIYSGGKSHTGDLLVDVGAGILIRKPIADAAKAIDTRKKEVEVVVDKLQDEMLSIVSKINELGSELQHMIGK